MTARRMGILMAGALGLAVLAGHRWGASAQQPAPPGVRPPAADARRFEFEVTESFDSRYLGDTPGHSGRNGGLNDARPNVALGDPVYHETQRVGTVTGLIWEKSKGALTVEFDPEPLQRISVGEPVWIARDSAEGPKAR